ncbi:MAG: uroporphyrinogen decarboxylase family protein [Promethearchaeota archaeon]
MKQDTLTSMDRIVGTLQQKEVDRVPFILALTHHGAIELGISIEDYYKSPENVIKGQILLQEKYQDDAVMGANFFAMEIEGWGGDVLYSKDGPPNTGRPPIRDFEMIDSLASPSFDHLPSYQNTLDIIAGLKEHFGSSMPIVGGVLAPFSLPIVQMGFDRYIELIYEHPDEFKKLMELNIEYSSKWANAQTKAGATFIVSFNPLASSDMIPRDIFLDKGYPVAERTFQKMEGLYGIHLASGRATKTFHDLARLKPIVIGVSASDNVKDLLLSYEMGPTILGNLSGINMVKWTSEQTSQIVKDLLSDVKSLGRLILADNHGEIPYYVPESNLLAISQAMDQYGRLNND